MTAKEMFEKLGYEQIIEKEGIQYIKQDDESEMQRVGMIQTKYIEFYTASKEILISTVYKHRSGTKSNSDSGILSFEEFSAVQTQIAELGWQN